MTMPTYGVLGRDIALTRYSGTAGAAPLDSADSWGTLDFRVVPNRSNADVRDVDAVQGRENLAQALILRLLTPKGSLTALGHPDYGSRLPELIGRENNESTRNLARLYTLEALGQEPRVAKLLALQLKPSMTLPETIEISFTVLPLNDSNPLALALEVTV